MKIESRVYINDRLIQVNVWPNCKDHFDAMTRLMSIIQKPDSTFRQTTPNTKGINFELNELHD